MPSRARLRARLTPGAGADQIDGVLRIRVAARPVDGAANDAMLRLMARALDVPRSRIAVVQGERGRLKVIEVDGIEPGALRSRWPGVDV